MKSFRFVLEFYSRLLTPNMGVSPGGWRSFQVFAWIWWWFCVCVSGECALKLTRAGASASSTLSHHVNEVFLSVPPTLVCVTYSDIEKALFSASSKIAVTQPEGDWTPEDLAPVGELLLETSRIIALQHGLTASEVAHYLPQVDMMRTSAASICPAFASPTLCTPGKYRRIDGLCNNIHHPTWGATRSVFQRFLPAAYSDGISSPRQSSVRGAALPNPRLVSAMVHRDKGFHDHAATLMLIAWGQLMDHDFTLTAMSLDPVNRNEPEGCCERPVGSKNPYCFEIEVPPRDRFYNLFRLRCIDFVRGFPGVPQNCHLGQRNQFNILTGVIDGNTVYGGTEEEARALRMGVGGLLRHYDHFPGMGLKTLLPLKTDIPDEGCIRENDSQFCFLAGEIRVNEQLILTCMHTLLMREHNRVASQLSELNPHWDDETLYQETRRIVAAIIQHITFNEFLPQLLGRNVMEQYDLILTKKGYWDGYDPSANPSISAAFAAAAFRFGHSLLPSSVERWSPSHKFIASTRLHKLIRQPFDMFRPGVLDEYFMGMLNQPAQAMDDSITQEVTNHLFAEPREKHGLDLVAFNLQRGREVGIPGYGAWRRMCGLPPIKTFTELAGYMTNATAAIYSQLYSSVEDIDLWSAGVSERPLSGSLLGPTFSCIIATQMQKLRRGDRFWYELPGQPSSFAPRQLEAIRRVQLSRLLCDNTDSMDTLQMYPFVLQDPSINPRVSCRSGIIPSLDLSAWKESPPVQLLPQVLPTSGNRPKSISSVRHQSYFYAFGI